MIPQQHRCRTQLGDFLSRMVFVAVPVIFIVLFAWPSQQPTQAPARFDFPCGPSEVLTAGRVCVATVELGAGLYNPAPEVPTPGWICVAPEPGAAELTCASWTGGEWDVDRGIPTGPRP